MQLTEEKPERSEEPQQKRGPIPAKDLAALEAVAKSSDARSQIWFPKTPKFLFRRWSYIVNEAQKFLRRQAHKAQIRPQWQDNLDTIERALSIHAHLDYLDSIEIMNCGDALLRLPPEIRVKFFTNLTAKQINVLTEIEKTYENKRLQQLEKFSRKFRQRPENGDSQPEVNPEPTLANVA